MKKATILLLLVIIPIFFLQGTAPNKTGKESGMSGIVFFNTNKLEELRTFYINRVGCSMWMDQGDCIILKHGNFLFGFCKREKADLCGLITFFYDKQEKVDRMYELFKDSTKSAPKKNPKYPIYHFFAADPEGRGIEFQYFTEPIDWKFE